MAEQEVLFEEAGPSDAKALVDFMNQVIVETDFLDLGAEAFTLTVEQTAELLDSYRAKADQLCFLAKIGGEIIGILNVTTADSYRVSHIGNIFLAVKKAYWGHGIGSILLEETIEWARKTELLKRLELTVQVRNERAVALYQKYGFEIEGTQRRGARTDEGEWLDLYYMGQLIGE